MRLANYSAPKSLLTGAALALAPAAFAQTTPAPTAEAAPKWEFYFEAGPKASIFRNVQHSTTVLDPRLGGALDPYSPEFTVDNTVSAFADVKAFRPITRHLLFGASTGLDMQQLDFSTSWRATVPGYRSYTSGERVVRLLTRVRVDAGLHAALGLGRAGELRPGVSLGQMLNVSKNGFSYSYAQGELAYAIGRVLLSARASVMPYNTTIPDVENIARRNDSSASVVRNEYRISELQVGIGVRL
ncbi:MAG: hypothetical protein M3Y12_14735 [Bacteroidota bacterium]|nr:hypothetical protein [Bacteroidota bacterium]